MSEKNKIFLFFIVIILAFVFASSFQSLYEIVFGSVPGSLFVPLRNIEGFVLGYIFFISIAITLFNKKIHRDLLILLIIALMLGFLSKSGNFIIASPVVILVSWLLAQLLLLIRKKIN